MRGWHVCVGIPPRVSPCYPAIIAGNIGKYAAQRGMRPTRRSASKWLLTPFSIPLSQWYPLTWRIERVHSYKILGIILSHDLTWNAHVDYTSKEANKRLYAIRILKKAWVSTRCQVVIHAKHSCPLKSSSSHQKLNAFLATSLLGFFQRIYL